MRQTHFIFLEKCSIITIGPSFKIDAKANVDIATDLQTSIGLKYQVDKLQLVFPPSYSAESYGDADPGDSCKLQ